MARSKRIGWLVPTLTLGVLWLVVTGLVVVLSGALNGALPDFIARGGPFLVAGVITGRLVDVSGPPRKGIAAGALALVSAAAWTLFTFASTTISGDRALALFALSLPVNLLGGAWAYFGMFLGGRRRGEPLMIEAVDPELDDLERELTSEIARERASQQDP